MDNNNDLFTPPPSSLQPIVSGASANNRPNPAPLWRGIRLLVAVLVCGLGVTTAIYFLRPVNINGQAQTGGGGKEPAKGPPLFAGWQKPDLAIVVSGEEHGFLKPCGCSRPQLGGLPRRYNFMDSLKAKGWPLVAVDIGEIAQTSGPQAILKYEYSMRALNLMKYRVVGLGKSEFNMPLMEALGRFALNNPDLPVLATNLRDPKGDFAQMGVKKFHLLSDVTPKLGFFSIVDSKVEKQITDPQSKFFNAAPDLAAALLANKASVNILLYQGAVAFDAQGKVDPKQEVGKFIADLNALRVKNPSIPQVPIVLCLTNDPEPPQRATIIGTTTVVAVGHKGRYVGVIGLFKNPANKGFELKYELVPMSEDYETKDNPVDVARNPVMRLLEEYAEKVEKEKLINNFPRGADHMQAELQAMGKDIKYVGSKACEKCHNDFQEFDAWTNSKHSHAFKDLVQAKHPSRRQFDGECVVCHTVGFQHTGGYLAPGNNADLNSKLENVGCESCHGPGGAHVKDKKNEAIHKLMNPYSTTRRIPDNIKNVPGLIATWKSKQFLKQDGFCQKCHDQENDVHWSEVPYDVKWKQIQHYRVPGGAGPGGAGAPAGGGVAPPEIKIEPMTPTGTTAPPMVPEVRPIAPK